MLIEKPIFAAIFILMLTTGAVQAGEDLAAGAALAVECAMCHGEDGKGNADIPALAGLDDADMIEQLKAFKSGERVDENELMPMYTEDLSDQDMADLAAYYATLSAD
jgi:cytochrome c553